MSWGIRCIDLKTRSISGRSTVMESIDQKIRSLSGRSTVELHLQTCNVLSLKAATVDSTKPDSLSVSVWM